MYELLPESSFRYKTTFYNVPDIEQMRGLLHNAQSSNFAPMLCSSHGSPVQCCSVQPSRLAGWLQSFTARRAWMETMKMESYGLTSRETYRKTLSPAILKWLWHSCKRHFPQPNIWQRDLAFGVLSQIYVIFFREKLKIVFQQTLHSDMIGSK